MAGVQNGNIGSRLEQTTPDRGDLCFTSEGDDVNDEDGS